MRSEAVIELRGLTKFYGKSRGVLCVDLVVKKGKILLFGQLNMGNTAQLRRDIGYLSGDIELYGTLKTLQSLPISRARVVLAKWASLAIITLVVVSAAALSGLLLGVLVVASLVFGLIGLLVYQQRDIQNA